KTLGWFTAWIYFWAGVITTTAVAATVPLVLSTIYPDQIKLGDPSPVAGLDMQSFIGLVTLVTTTVINVVGVRLLALINNIGVAAEIFGMVVFALILLFFANHQSPAILFDTSYTSGLANGNYGAVFLVGMFMALFVVYGFDTAGPSARRQWMPDATPLAAYSRRSGSRASSARSFSCPARCRATMSPRPALRAK